MRTTPLPFQKGKAYDSNYISGESFMGKKKKTLYSALRITKNVLLLSNIEVRLKAIIL